MYNTRESESFCPRKPGSPHAANTAWLMDKTIGKIVLHNRSQKPNQSGNTWRSCVSGTTRGDR